MPMLSTFGGGSVRGYRAGGGGGGPLLTLVPTGGGATIEWDGSTNLSLSASEEYTVTAARDGSVAVKMWGGGGARGYKFNDAFATEARQGPGGGGGYTSGTIGFVSGSTYIFQVGEGGARSQTAITGATWKAGGLPSSIGGTEGAGYSGIFSSSVSQANALLIAGGGGGGSDTSYSDHGGGGGGANGQDAEESTQGAHGGSQTAGGAPSDYNSATAGGALIGGVAGYYTVSPHGTLGGGGGGYYGGGGGNVGGGGGGSGYFKTSSPVSNGSTIAASISTPPNSSDADRSGAGNGGSATQGSTGADGIIVLLAEA